MDDTRKIESLISELSRPLWLFRAHGPNNPRGSAKVRDGAAIEIDRIVLEYVRRKGTS